MALPINIEDLIKGNTVEWERIEFKSGWNPETIIHTLCAFANDLHNWGGGYITIGINENNGKPELPPIGLNENCLDKLQKEIINIGYQIQPNYFPIIQPYILQGKHILVLWCPAGDNRMYTAPVTLGSKAQRQPYIRVGSESIIAKDENLRQLLEQTAHIPFDDRINHQAKIDDFDLSLIQAHLQEIKSDLYAESTRMPLVDLAKAMYIAKGPEEDLRPVNVGLLFFSKNPEKFFPRSWIELVWHKDGSGQLFEEYYFKGCIQKQLRNVLDFIRTNIIAEKVIKQKNKAEALRFYNFPYVAIEEALSNAIYHKSYERQSPIEIQIWPDKIEILSFPGPVPPVDFKVLKTKRRIVAREYRNRRIGDFLKELQLTEGRGTGFPAIYGALEANGSPKPIFETDDISSYFLAIIPAHSLADKIFTKPSADIDIKLTFSNINDLIDFANQVSDQVSDILNKEIHGRVKEMLVLLQQRIPRTELFEKMGLKNHSDNRARYLDPLLALGWVEMEFPNRRTSPKQTYKISGSGERILLLLDGRSN